MSRLRPAVLAFDPQPIHIRLVRCANEDDDYTGIYRLWETAVGARCRLCPRDQCNLLGVAGMGLSTCIVVVQARALPDLPAAVTLRG